LIFSGVLYGISSSTFVLASLSMIGGLSGEKEKQRLLVLFTLSSAIGAVLGPAFLSILLLFTEIKNAFILSLILVLFSLCLFYFGIKGFSEARNTSPSFKASLGRILRNRNIIASSIILACSSLALNVVNTFLPVLLIDKLSLNPELAVTFFAIRSFMFIFMRLLILLNIQDKIGVKRFLIMTLLLHSGLAAVAFSHDVVGLLLPVVLSGLAHGAIYPMSSYVVSKAASPEETGLANAFFMFIVDASNFLSSVLLGLVAEVLDISLVFIIGGMVPIAGALVSAIMIRIASEGTS